MKPRNLKRLQIVGLVTLLAGCLIFLSRCATEGQFWNLNSCGRQAAQDFYWHDGPKKIVVSLTQRNNFHAHTEILRYGKWVPADTRWYSTPKYVYNTYYSLDDFLKSGWVKEGH